MKGGGRKNKKATAEISAMSRTTSQKLTGMRKGSAGRRSDKGVTIGFMPSPVDPWTKRLPR